MSIGTQAPVRSPAHAAGPELAVTGRHLPALDGLRALAVAGVLAYHLQLGWASGGYLGVDLFFVLSGFLITTLLLEEWLTSDGIRLPAFWARRARRLLPALFLVLVAIAAYVVLEGNFGAPGAVAHIDLGQLRGDALSSLFYVANWHFIFSHQSYFEQFSSPSPLAHTWSLAIEEQFYLVWPPLLLLGLKVLRGRWRAAGVAFTVVGALASAAWMSALYHGGSGTSRVYYGTDTRIFDMLAGATVAMVVAGRGQPGRRARQALHVAGPLAAVALGVFWVTAGRASGSTLAMPPAWMYHGGFLVCAVLAAVVIADARQLHRGLLARALAWGPLPWIGMVSYGIYLWHWPVFVYLTEERTGLAQPWLDLARIGITVGLSTASFYLVERPVRQRRWPRGARIALVPAVVVTATCVVVATIPAIAAPTPPAPTTAAVSAAHVAAVPGAGWSAAERPIVLHQAHPISPSNPLRVMLIGDSVMWVAEQGVANALTATGEVTVTQRAFPGWGLSTDAGWHTSLSELIAQSHPQLIVGTWSWDDDCTAAQQAAGLVCALQHPVRYKRELEQAVRFLLAPSTGVQGVVFLQFPRTGPVQGVDDPAVVRADDAERAAGQRAWDAVVRTMPAAFPGKVMYLPVAQAVLLHGRFTTWLPPEGDPHAHRADWVRVRMADDVHLCPAGVVRFADALLADLTGLFHLAPAKPGWWNAAWVQSPHFNDPPGACPDDHPPA